MPGKLHLKREGSPCTGEGGQGKEPSTGRGAPGMGGAHQGGKAFPFPLPGLQRVRSRGSGGAVSGMKVELAVLRRGSTYD